MLNPFKLTIINSGERIQQCNKIFFLLDQQQESYMFEQLKHIQLCVYSPSKA